MGYATTGYENTGILEFIKNKAEYTMSYPQTASVSVEDITAFVLESEGIYCAYNGTAYGFIRKNGEKLSDYIYDTAYPFSEELACVSTGGKYGYLDQNGKVAIPFLYDYATPFVEGLAYYVKGEEYGFLDRDGTVVFHLDCDSVSSFQEGLAFYSIDGKYGYLDKTGNIVIAPSYEDAGYFRNGLAEVTRNGWHGVIGMDGQEAIALEYENVSWNEYLILAEKEGKFTCFDRTGSRILEGEYDSIWLEGDLICFEKNKKYGVADKSGTVMIEPIYDILSLVSEKEMAIVRNKDQYGVVDFYGKEKIPFLYDWISYDKNAALFTVCMDGKWGCLDASDFSEQIPILYDRIDPFVDGQAVVSLEYEDQAIDPIAQEAVGQAEVSSNQVYQVMKMDDICALPMAEVSSDQIYQVMDRDGNLVFSVACEGLVRLGDYYRVTRNEKYGFLNKNGEEILPAVYEKFSFQTYLLNSEIYWIEQDSVALDNGKDCQIISVGESKEADLLKLFLRNEITPRISAFYHLIHQKRMHTINRAYDNDSGTNFVEEEEWNRSVKLYKLYDIAHSGKPVLYYFIKPYYQMHRPLSYSGIYASKGEEVTELALGYECGGTMGGDIACIYHDRETSELLIGIIGSWGGFRGHASEKELYTYQDGEATFLTSIYMRSDLNYDDSVTTDYFINDIPTTEEEYTKTQERYQRVPLIGIE